MISGQWFHRKRSKNWKILHKFTHNFINNTGSTLVLTNLEGVFPRDTHTKFEANPCSGLIKVKELKKFTTTITMTTKTGRSLQSHSLIECDYITKNTNMINENNNNV